MVSVVACDVADRGQVEVVLGGAREEFPLTAVIHAAGVLDDGVIGSLHGSASAGCSPPKADWAWHLHELTEHLEVAAFVLFSSMPPTFGSPGQGSYAAGNAFLDALAFYRRAQGLAATSIAWGWWSREMGLSGG